MSDLNEINQQTEEQLAACLRTLVKSHDDWRTEECINLQAAESTISPMVQGPLHSDLERRSITEEIGSRGNKGVGWKQESLFFHKP